MKAIPPALQAHLDSRATTLCWCWRLTRRDGTVFGFTDHDRDVTFGGTTYEAAAGVTASELKEDLGLSVDNVEVSGALSSDRLSEADLRAGLYDDAKVEIFRVNWQVVDQRVLMRTGSLGEVRRAGSAFTAEVRGLSHYLQQPKGRLFQYSCDADVGDGRCKINLNQPSLKGLGTIATVDGDRYFTASGLDGYVSDWFSRGVVRFTSGAAAGQSIEVKTHRRTASSISFELWQAARQPLVPGQTFTVTAGCDKAIGTCRAKFSNAVNFRGFPHMPGNDFVMAISRPGQSTS